MWYDDNIEVWYVVCDVYDILCVRVSGMLIFIPFSRDIAVLLSCLGDGFLTSVIYSRSYVENFLYPIFHHTRSVTGHNCV